MNLYNHNNLNLSFVLIKRLSNIDPKALFEEQTMYREEKVIWSDIRDLFYYKVILSLQDKTEKWEDSIQTKYCNYIISSLLATGSFRFRMFEDFIYF